MKENISVVSGVFSGISHSKSLFSKINLQIHFSFWGGKEGEDWRFSAVTGSVRSYVNILEGNFFHILKKFSNK